MASKTPTQPNFKDALSTYYQLKGKYENKINSSVQEIVLNKNLSKSEKFELFKNLKKKCINCGKPGGMLFGQSQNMLTVKCGNSENPCNLDIQLEKASYTLLSNDLTSNNNNLTYLKNKIIDTKLDYLFGFNDKENTLQKFNEFKDNLVKEVKIYQKNSEKYLVATQNLDNIQDIEKLEETLSLEIFNFKELITNFNSSKSIAFIKEAVELYVNRLNEISKNIQTLKYKHEDVDKNYKTGENILIQKSYTLNDLLNIKPGTQNRIVSFSL
tara:strand:+ start:1402 stop:2211 length:810 start_codon:yes stop_codon:yes gene_type:complete